VKDTAQVQDSVAKGETEIGLGPYLSEMRNPALDVVGPLPPGLDPGRYHRVPFRERERLEGSQSVARLSCIPGWGSGI
jgi:hypothetical protein